jgi:hypothetical protein
MVQNALRSTIRLSFLLATLSFLPASPARAQGPGIRGGVSIDPDQLYFGGHYETSPLIERLHFRPNIEAGVGDDVTTVGVNMEFLYKFPRRNTWSLYAGGGPAISFVRVETGRGTDNTNTDGGLNLLVGAEQTRGLFFDMKIGVASGPELKFGVGWTFR